MTWRLAGEVEPLAHRDPAALTAAALERELLGA